MSPQDRTGAGGAVRYGAGFLLTDLYQLNMMQAYPRQTVASTAANAVYDSA